MGPIAHGGGKMATNSTSLVFSFPQSKNIKTKENDNENETINVFVGFYKPTKALPTWPYQELRTSLNH